MAAYISKALLEKEYNEHKSGLNIVPIGMPYTTFGKMMNEKYRFNDKELDDLNLKESFNHIKIHHTKKT